MRLLLLLLLLLRNRTAGKLVGAQNGRILTTSGMNVSWNLRATTAEDESGYVSSGEGPLFLLSALCSLLPALCSLLPALCPLSALLVLALVLVLVLCVCLPLSLFLSLYIPIPIRVPTHIHVHNQ